MIHSEPVGWQTGALRDQAAGESGRGWLVHTKARTKILYTDMMATLAGMVFVMLLCLSLQPGVTRGASYTLDDSGGLGRRFDGIGGLSGGGVSII